VRSSFRGCPHSWFWRHYFGDAGWCGVRWSPLKTRLFSIKQVSDSFPFWIPFFPLPSTSAVKLHVSLCEKERVFARFPFDPSEWFFQWLFPSPPLVYWLALSPVLESGFHSGRRQARKRGSPPSPFQWLAIHGFFCFLPHGPLN